LIEQHQADFARNSASPQTEIDRDRAPAVEDLPRGLRDDLIIPVVCYIVRQRRELNSNLLMAVAASLAKSSIRPMFY